MLYSKQSTDITMWLHYDNWEVCCIRYNLRQYFCRLVTTAYPYTKKVYLHNTCELFLLSLYSRHNRTKCNNNLMNYISYIAKNSLVCYSFNGKRWGSFLALKHFKSNQNIKFPLYRHQIIKMRTEYRGWSNQKRGNNSYI